jgi:coproporphyrinogen III oxidase
MLEIEIKKKLADNWFNYLQLEICKQFKDLEKEISNKPKLFKKRVWKKKIKKEGGGVSFLLTGGEVFDKVGVNKSTVSGIFKKEYKSKIPGAKNGKYWASGISVVAHMKNPKIPAIHFNTRFIVTKNSWFGGGVDVTPSFEDFQEKKKVHKQLKELCLNNKKNYLKYKKWCDKYFYLPHQQESRGIGGIFFDYETMDWDKNFKFVRELGLTFIKLSKSIILKKIKSKWSLKDKEKQMYKRAKYIEFNLLYDRGTKFGLNTGGNIKSILMSLPPSAKWK